jgi:hypothetical protein
MAESGSNWAEVNPQQHLIMNAESIGHFGRRARLSNTASAQRYRGALFTRGARSQRKRAHPIRLHRKRLSLPQRGVARNRLCRSECDPRLHCVQRRDPRGHRPPQSPGRGRGPRHPGRAYIRLRRTATFGKNRVQGRPHYRNDGHSPRRRHRVAPPDNSSAPLPLPRHPIWRPWRTPRPTLTPSRVGPRSHPPMRTKETYPPQEGADTRDPPRRRVRSIAIIPQLTTRNRPAAGQRPQTWPRADSCDRPQSGHPS